MGKQDRDMRLLEQVGKAKERDMRPSTKQRSLYLAMALFTVLAPLRKLCICLESPDGGSRDASRRFFSLFFLFSFFSFFRTCS